MNLIVYFFKFVYAVDEKKLTEQIHSLKKEKEEALTKMSELQKQVCYKYNGSLYDRATFVEACMLISGFFFFFFFLKTNQLKENQKQSKEKVSCMTKIMQDLEVSTKNSIYLSNFLVFY